MKIFLVVVAVVTIFGALMSPPQARGFGLPMEGFSIQEPLIEQYLGLGSGKLEEATRNKIIQTLRQRGASVGKKGFRSPWIQFSLVSGWRDDGPESYQKTLKLYVEFDGEFDKPLKERFEIPTQDVSENLVADQAAAYIAASLETWWKTYQKR